MHKRCNLFLIEIFSRDDAHLSTIIRQINAISGVGVLVDVDEREPSGLREGPGVRELRCQRILGPKLS
jgi:hypothetical protein